MKCKGLVFLIEKVFKESVEEVFSRSLVVFCFKEVKWSKIGSRSIVVVGD